MGVNARNTPRSTHPYGVCAGKTENARTKRETNHNTTPNTDTAGYTSKTSARTTPDRCFLHARSTRQKNSGNTAHVCSLLKPTHTPVVQSTWYQAVPLFHDRCKIQQLISNTSIGTLTKPETSCAASERRRTQIHGTTRHVLLCADAKTMPQISASASCTPVVSTKNARQNIRGVHADQTRGLGAGD